MGKLGGEMMIGGIVWMVNIHCEALEVGSGYLIPLPFLLLGEENFHLNIFVFSSFLCCEISVHVH